MNIFSASTISKFTLAMLMLFSMAFFVMPAQNASAQSNNSFSACLNTSNGTLTTPSTSGCATNTTAVGLPRFYSDANGSQQSYNGTCVGLKPNVSPTTYQAGPPLTDSTGTILNSVGTKCLQARGNDNTAFADFWPFSRIQGGSTPPVITPPTNTPPIKPPVNAPPTSGGTTSSTGCDTPEPGFHKVGPLCVPDNPFDANSIAGGDQTASSLAVKIIHILLYMAAIVAVFMMIIGGYYVMTAGGNETQATNGRKTLTNAIIGLVIIILAYVIVQVVINFVTK